MATLTEARAVSPEDVLLGVGDLPLSEASEISSYFGVIGIAEKSLSPAVEVADSGYGIGYYLISLPQSMFLNQQWSIDTPDLGYLYSNRQWEVAAYDRPSVYLNQQYALAAPSLEKLLLDALWELASGAFYTSYLNQQYNLEAPQGPLIKYLDQCWDIQALSGPYTLFLNNSWELLAPEGLNIFLLDQQYSVTGSPVSSLNLVDIYYQLYVGTELIPFSSLQGRKRNSGKDMIYLVIPNGRAWIDAITAQQGQDLVVKRGGRLRSDLTPVAPAEFIRATFENSSYDKGSRSSSITLMGFRDVDPPGTAKGIEVKDVSYLVTGMDGKRRVRCRMDDTLNYNDQVTLPDETFFTVGEISYSIGEARFQMEAKEI